MNKDLPGITVPLGKVAKATFHGGRPNSRETVRQNQNVQIKKLLVVIFGLMC